MVKVFVENAPYCPECPNGPMVWDEDEYGWYCLNCGYFDDTDEEDTDYMFEDVEVPEPVTFKESILNAIGKRDEMTYKQLKEVVLKELDKVLKELKDDGEIYEPEEGVYKIL
ncbi:hypothetical protein [Methanothermococcus thermolithotrophicus]|uniref:hypothetical protein n=1 Tax=Methanothermococcus thermolithotrophicus TaxID=2186 RepID=UPI000360FD9D|nr:hypothetical protein [Methanothermococcus thermolithotrophicus]